tara:strand:- start:240 stop:1109 length:870 start_codon:yes stop_codon:yes gene_type:complete
MAQYYKVPISYYHLFLRVDSKEGLEFTRKKLNLYKNWKRKTILILLNLKLLPKKEIDSKADVIFYGNRTKEIHFSKKIILTRGNCKIDFRERVLMNKYFKCIKNPKYSSKILEEEFIWPTKELTNENVSKIFEELIKYYKKNLKKIPISKIIASRKKRLPYLNRSFSFSKEKILSSNMHGDFWKGNLETDLENNIWIFDWGQSGFGTILEDFFNYFLIEYFYTKSLNNDFFYKIFELFKKEFDLPVKKIIDLICLETQLNKLNRPKNQWKTLEFFNTEIINLLKSISFS